MKTSGHVYKFMTQSISARYGLFYGPDCPPAAHNIRRYRYEDAAENRDTITRCELVGHFTVNFLKTAYFTWSLILGCLFALQFCIEGVTETLGWSGDHHFLPLYFHRLLELVANTLGLHDTIGGDATPWYLFAYSVISFLVVFGPAAVVAIMFTTVVVIIGAAFTIASISLIAYVLYVCTMSAFIAVAGGAGDRRLIVEYFHELTSLFVDDDRVLPSYWMLAGDVVRRRLSMIRFPRLFAVVTSKVRRLDISKSCACKPINFTED